MGASTATTSNALSRAGEGAVHSIQAEIAKTEVHPLLPAPSPPLPRSTPIRKNCWVASQCLPDRRLAVTRSCSFTFSSSAASRMLRTSYLLAKIPRAFHEILKSSARVLIALVVRRSTAATCTADRPPLIKFNNSWSSRSDQGFRPLCERDLSSGWDDFIWLDHMQND